MYIILLHNFNFEVCMIVEETKLHTLLEGGRRGGVVSVFHLWVMEMELNLVLNWTGSEFITFECNCLDRL
jgi:hypothetical protein